MTEIQAESNEFYCRLFVRLLYEAFVAGFESSGEGFNGECPFGDKGVDVASSPTILANFQEWLKEKKRDVCDEM